MKSLHQNERGVAILMVMGVIAILSFILAEFTFDTKLNKIRIYNQQDKAQARLAAESGLNFALARLRLYQEGRNFIEKDENIKKAFSPDKLEAFLNTEFAFPLPVSAKDDLIKKSAINDFQKDTLLKGSFIITVDKLSGFLNPNALRIRPTKNQNNQNSDMANSGADQGPDAENPDADLNPNENSNSGQANNNQNTTPIHVIIEKKIEETLQRLIEDKAKTDDAFNAKYSNVNAKDLVKELKYFVNDKNKVNDVDVGDLENKFQQKNLSPKHAPMSSIDELYLLPSWDEEIIELVKGRFSVHEVGVIGINELTIDDLKVLFPNITPPQLEEFFKSRDGDKEKNIEGKPFESEEDFKNRLINELRIVSQEDYDKLVKELKSAKLRFDVAGKLYKVTSVGTVNNTVYKLVAFVDLPIKEPKVKSDNNGQNNSGNNQNTNNQNPDGQNPNANNDPNNQNKKDPPVELLPPRVVEIRLE